MNRHLTNRTPPPHQVASGNYWRREVFASYPVAMQWTIVRRINGELYQFEVRETMASIEATGGLAAVPGLRRARRMLTTHTKSATAQAITAARHPLRF